MTTVYLIRHAEAEGNVFRRLQGQFNAGVTSNGRRQIAELQKRFAEVPVDAVYSSDLRRACITAEAIYKPKNLPLHTDRRFRELNCGVWEDLPFGWLDHSDPVRNRAFSHDPRHWSVEGSETYPIYTGRFLEALDEVVRRHEGQSVAIFSHGMVLRGVQQRLFFPERDDLTHSENTAVSKLRWEDGEYTLEYINDASHLPEAITTLGRQMWWRGGDSRDFNMWYRDPLPEDAALLETLEMPEGEVVRVSVLGEAPVGALALRAADPETDILLWLALLPEHRRIGLSAQLLGEAIHTARRRGKRCLRLGGQAVHPAAVRLFSAYGLADGALDIAI